MPILVAVACFFPGQAKDLSAPPCVCVCARACAHTHTHIYARPDLGTLQTVAYNITSGTSSNYNRKLVTYFKK